MAKLPESYFVGEDVVMIAQDLIGKVLFTHINDQITAGRIIETEAYCGLTDKACHAHLKRTKRTETMYQRGGIAYVYLCYGVHEMFNIVTNQEGFADAILIRALEPLEGTEIMKQRTQKRDGSRITSGPGLVTKAMGISRIHNGIKLTDDMIWIEEGSASEITVDRRVGVDYAGEDAALLWRFFEKGNQWVSKSIQKPFESKLSAKARSANLRIL